MRIRDARTRGAATDAAATSPGYRAIECTTASASARGVFSTGASGGGMTSALRAASVPTALRRRDAPLSRCAILPSTSTDHTRARSKRVARLLRRATHAQQAGCAPTPVCSCGAARHRRRSEGGRPWHETLGRYLPQPRVGRDAARRAIPGSHPTGALSSRLTLRWLCAGAAADSL